jgi:cytochrome b561
MAMQLNSLSKPAHYDAISKAAHWLTFILIAAEYAVAWTMPEIERNTQPETLIKLHLSLGASLLALVVFRIMWRTGHPAPPRGVGVTRLEAQLARITHFCLYALLLIMPLAGWAAASVRGWAVNLLGFIPLPRLLPAGTKMGFELGDLHADILSWVLLAVIGLHVAAALYHRLIRRDGVLQRMLPTR